MTQFNTTFAFLVGTVPANKSTSGHFFRDTHKWRWFGGGIPHSLLFFTPINLFCNENSTFFASWFLAKEKCQEGSFGGYILNKYRLKFMFRSLDCTADKVSHFERNHLKELAVYQNMWQRSKKHDKHVNHSLEILTGWSSSCGSYFYINLTAKLYFIIRCIFFWSNTRLS